MSGLVQTAPSRHQAVVALSAGAVLPAERAATAPHAAPQAVTPPVLSQVLFCDALLRERRRADRFEDAFALALISLDRRHQPASIWQRIVDALSTPGHDVDLVGWFEQGSVLGVISVLDEHDPARPAAGDTARVRARLLASLGPELAGECSVRVELYSPSASATPAVVFDAPGTRRTPRQQLRDAVKRGLDIVGSAALLVLLAPVFLAVALVVKGSSPGPVFFSQYRVGRGGRLFRMFKFRTMQADADPAIHYRYVESFVRTNQPAQEETARVFKLVNDPRVTRVGKLLRKSSLDELPQFWNVLKGEMSLVGPRPPLAHEVSRYRPWHRRRVLEAKPGMTGLWQVTGRSRVTFDEMVRLDLWYARHRSTRTDLKILLATPRAVLSGRGAH